MNHIKLLKVAITLVCTVTVVGCKVPAIVTHIPDTNSPEQYPDSKDTANIASINWRDYFTDKYLQVLIDTALSNNKELKKTLQEIEIARYEIKARKGAILPAVSMGVGIGVDKSARYTVNGAGEEQTSIVPGQEPTALIGDGRIGLYANWEADIWKKLRNAKAAAIDRYLATEDGKNFVTTNLIAEVANTYYELCALDNELNIVRQTIALQNNALEIVKVQKQAARATELGVQKFQAEVLSSQSLEFDISQQITETENKLNLLLGRYPQSIVRDNEAFLNQLPRAVQNGIPSQLLSNRPDIRQAEHEMIAAKLDVKVARAAFYPRLDITAGIGLEAFKPSYFLKLPESIFMSLAGDLVAPLVNKNAIKADFYSADARQLQSMYNYEQTILNAYVDVANQLSQIKNLEKSYDLKSKQVDALRKSTDIANDLFKYARADYFEVLMTQRDALQSQLELIETKEKQYNATVNIYQALGGGWQ